MAKGGRGKRKGSAWERKVCVHLSKWITKGKRNDVFWRTAMSGGRATVRGHDVIRQAGDICAVAEEGHPFTDKFIVECKAYRNVQIESFVIANKGRLAKWWRKLLLECEAQKKLPILIVKQNNTPTLVFSTLPFPERIWHGCNVLLLSEFLALDPKIVLSMNKLISPFTGESC